MTKEVTPPEKRNPTGKGGFGDHPEHRSDGRWSKENSFSYWYNFFKALSVKEFKEYEKTKAEDDRSVAESLAYARVVKARNDLKEFQEVADRSEGKARQSVDVTTGGEKLNVALVRFLDAPEPDSPDRSPDTR